MGTQSFSTLTLKAQKREDNTREERKEKQGEEILLQTILDTPQVIQ